MSSGIDYHIVDAFATGPFTGNQAAVVVTTRMLCKRSPRSYPSYHLTGSYLITWVSDREFNLAETAFAVPISPDDPSTYNLKWFTPDSEEKLCGHATLATTHVIQSLPQVQGVQSITYHTLSGPLKAEKAGDGLLELDFPADDVVTLEHGEEWSAIAKAAMKTMREQGAVKAIYRGNLDLAIEVDMKPGVGLADLDLDINALVGNTYRYRISAHSFHSSDYPNAG
jgi:PhzF family phenazine biosynthesis protein